MAFLKDSEYERRKATNFLVVHCTATAPHVDVGVKEVREWHIKQRGFKDIGYHYLIRRDGTVEMGRPTWAIGSHVEGHNWEAVGVCLVGGVPEDNKATPENESLMQSQYNFTPAQMLALQNVLRLLKRDSYKTAQVVGHHDIEIVNKKACPSFDAKAWWAPFDKAVQKEITNAQCLR